MKPEIHPKYGKSEVKCACGAVFETRSTKPKILVEICSSCHPFYTGKKKLIDTTGRVERFEKLMAKKKPKKVKAKAEKAEKAVKPKKTEAAAHSTDSTNSPQASPEQEAKK
jgi:large subunit ribosomal protein L31